MKKRTKVMLIIAGVATTTGMIISTVAAGLLITSPQNKGEKQTHTITENISKIDVNVDYNDIRIVPTDSDKITVTYLSNQTRQYNITTENKTLKIENKHMQELDLEWYDKYITFDYNFDKDLVIYVPRIMTPDINLVSNMGDINIFGIKGDLTSNTSYGDLEISDCEFSTLKSSTQSGDVEFSDSKIGSIELYSQSGDIDFENVTANITSQNECGDVDLNNVSGDKININAQYGDISGALRGPKSDYTINSSTNVGDNNLKNTNTNGKKTLDLNTQLGDIYIEFIN